MLTKFNILYEEILKELDKTKYIPAKFIDGTNAFGTDYEGNKQQWLIRFFIIK
jgi:hypothetical protein